MIKSITLKNWKSFGEATLYVDPLTVLIGTNASGKSNFLDSLVFLGELARGKSVNEALSGTGNGYKGIRGGGRSVIRLGEGFTRICVDFASPEKAGITFVYEVIIKKSAASAYVLSSETLTKTVAGETTELLSFKDIGHSFLQMDTLRWISEVVKDEETGKTILWAEEQLGSDLEKLEVIDPIPQNMRGFSTLSQSLQPDGSNLAGYLAKHPQKAIIEARLSDALRELPENEVVKIWSEPVGRLETDAMLYCEERWSGKKEPKLFDAHSLSDGTLRLVAILSAILSAKKGSTIVVEEIDNGLHPSRANLLVKLLQKFGKEQEVDIICTTHNSVLLDAFGNEMIPCISVVYRDDETGNSKIKLLEDFKNLPRLIAKGSVGTLAAKGILEAAANK